MIQGMNRTWKASFLGEITFNLGSVVVMQLLMIGIPDPTKKIILRSNNKSAIRHLHPKILTVRPPPTPCPEKTPPNKQNQKHHLGCPQTATLKGLKQAEAGLMSCQQPTKKSPRKFTLLKKHCQQKIVTKSAQFLFFIESQAVR